MEKVENFAKGFEPTRYRDSTPTKMSIFLKMMEESLCWLLLSDIILRFFYMTFELVKLLSQNWNEQTSALNELLWGGFGSSFNNPVTSSRRNLES